MNFFKKTVSVASILTVLSISAATIIPNYGTAYAQASTTTPTLTLAQRNKMILCAGVKCST